MHLLTRRQGRFSVPDRFLIRGDLLTLYRDRVRGHNGRPMQVGDRKFRFIETSKGSVIATVIKPRVKRRKSKTVAKKLTVTRKKSPKDSPQRISPDTVTVSMEELDRVVKVITNQFPASGSILFSKFDKLLDENVCRASFKEYSSRPNWISTGLVMRIPGKHDAKLLRKTKTGYQLVTIYGGTKEVNSRMGFKSDI